MNYRNFLKNEYSEAGQTPWQIKIRGKLLTIPYFYSLDAADKQEIATRFCKDFFDVNDRLAREYRKHGEKPLVVESEGQKYVVPYRYAGRSYHTDEIAEKVFDKCLRKYHRAISLTQKINRLAPEEEQIVSISEESCRRSRRKYEKLLAGKIMDTAARGLIKAGEFLAAGARSVCEKGLGIDVAQMKRYVKRTIIGTAIVGGSYLACQHPFVQQKLKGLSEYVVSKKTTENKMCFAEVCGSKYDDRYGNLQTLDKAYDDLCVVLASLEGFHREAFDDGLGNWTIGYGSTFYIDENGRDAGKIQPGDEITAEEAFMQKQRYIAKYMVPCLMRVQRPLSEKEVVGFIATGFCIGQNELRNSRFLKLLSEGDTQAWQSLSVYGKQAGVRKRTALTGAYVKGEVSTRDLLDFGWKNGENVYGAEISDFYKCPEGSQIPYKNAQGFCRDVYYDKVGDYVRGTIARGVKNPVRDILPVSVVNNIEKGRSVYSLAANRER